MERKHTKIEGKHKMESLKKLAATRMHGRRSRVPSAKRQRRERVTDADACLEQNANDAYAWRKRTRDKENSQMTRPRDLCGRVTDATHQKLQKTLPAISEALFGPNPSPESTDQRLWSGKMHPFKGSHQLVTFWWIRCSFEGDVLSSLF